ncbi:MAG: ferric reductase-like transmembrane domain-containing protein [Gammaproteobacteria bacterium]|uniref:Rieske 2Fe-2S domain-containing protein n=1 Tax=Thalassobaculum sp. TaxID=2022740 RepID=UPI0032EE42DF
MSARYRPVQWTRSKVAYDLCLGGGVALYLLLYLRWAPGLVESTLIGGAELRMRAFGTCALWMLTLILCIGPLARLDRRFLPILYNRRHFGVLTFFVAVAHLYAVLGWYTAFSPIDPWVALLGSNTDLSFLGFPFEWLGLAALVVLFAMAATSHDFWLAFLTPPVWKRLHMLVYAAYGLVIMHVTLGVLQAETNLAYAAMTGISLAAVAGLHVVAGRVEARRDAVPESDMAGWVQVARIDELEDGVGRTVTLPDGERAAVFRHGNKISALSNACAHQNGPLGEGRILDGCVTCPWHGFQYDPETGCAPAPFTEKVATYRLKRDGDRLLIDPRALPPGTRTEPVRLAEAAS